MDSLYKKKRKQQMLRFFGATTLTLISCRFMMKFLTPRVESPLVNNLVKKQYKPNYFQFNHKIPNELISKYGNNNIKNKSQYKNEPRMISVVMGTIGITSGLLLMSVTGTLWTLNVSTLNEWRQLCKI
ncbi:hypothetical protein RI543_003346 [Arxiozyma heterogenica]|uniref:Altered inheritance of mitochondria protein 11 n=1 Tax=Arxiozyma heterogenica TaxID=278026 RepID=A0AAN7WL99_9SACH|nr:hypothetical protein RI543_003346 [Kazachstania heterogenica]